MKRYVYVIRLDDVVLEVKRFRERNPEYREGKPCVYVGSTGLSPDERFRNHKNGIIAFQFVRKFGLYIVRRKCVCLENCTTKQAETTERELAERLRRKG